MNTAESTLRVACHHRSGKYKIWSEKLNSVVVHCTLLVYYYIGEMYPVLNGSIHGFFLFHQFPLHQIYAVNSHFDYDKVPMQLLQSGMQFPFLFLIRSCENSMQTGRLKIQILLKHSMWLNMLFGLAFGSFAFNVYPSYLTWTTSCNLERQGISALYMCVWLVWLQLWEVNKRTGVAWSLSYLVL